MSMIVCMHWRVASRPAQIRPTEYEEEAVEHPYYHTTWSVKPDMEAEFVRRWSEWAEWSHREGLNAPALLLRDLENPGTFISFGPWQSATAVKNWRALAGTTNGWRDCARLSTASSRGRSRSPLAYSAAQPTISSSRCATGVPLPVSMGHS